MDTTNAKKMQV